MNLILDAQSVIPYLIGLCCGVFSGLVPGIHSNTITQLLAKLLAQDVIGIVVMLTVGIYSVLSFFPAIFLGVPDDNTVVSVLPGHRLVKRGKGFLALKAVCASASLSIVITLLFIPVAFAIYGTLYNMILPFLPFILICAVIILVASEKEKKKMGKSFAVIIASGMLGYLSLSLPIKQPLFPMFVGFFAIPALLYSTGKITAKIDRKTLKMPLNVVLLGIVMGFVADLLPGMSTGAQMAVFASPLFTVTDINFLIFTSSLTVSHIIFAIPSRMETGKARIGAFSFVNDIEAQFGTYLFLLIVGMFIGIAILSVIINKVRRLNIDLSKIEKVIIGYLTIIVLLVSGFTGLAMLLSSSILGIIVLVTGVRRVHLMGSIILPTILLLL